MNMQFVNIKYKQPSENDKVTILKFCFSQDYKVKYCMMKY